MPPVAGGGYPVPVPEPTEPALPNAHDAMRHLWMDHIVGARVLIMSTFSELKGKAAYEKRLVTNSYDMETLITPYFGEENAAYFGNLYLQHITLTSTVLEAYKSGNETWIRDVTYDWYLNAEEIAHFLCKVNLAWDEAEMQSLWKLHLDQVIDEMLDYKNDDFEGDVMCYDIVQDHAFALADYLSDKMILQGPKKK